MLLKPKDSVLGWSVLTFHKAELVYVAKACHCFAYICNFQYCIEKMMVFGANSMDIDIGLRKFLLLNNGCLWQSGVVYSSFISLYIINTHRTQLWLKEIPAIYDNRWCMQCNAMQIVMCPYRSQFDVDVTLFLLLHSSVSRSKLHLCSRIHFYHHDTI